MSLFADLVPDSRYSYTTSPDAVEIYDPVTGTSHLNPLMGATTAIAASRDGTNAALATQLGGGSSIVPISQRIGDHPDTATYGANFGKANYVWLRGGDPSSLVMRPAPGGTAPAPSAPPATGTTPPSGTAPSGSTPAGAPAPSALGAWNTFYNSPAYQVPLAEGLDAVNTKYAAMGALESGAAMKAINDYAAGHAASALGTYMDDLYRQQALGVQAASALSGVGTNMVNQVSANNNNAASASGNAILTGGQAAANNWNNVGSAIGTAAGSISGALGSSYRAPTPYPYGQINVTPGTTVPFNY